MPASSASSAMVALAFAIAFAVATASSSCPNINHSLQEVIDNQDLKFIFVGGKGGVGKTTTSSSFAIQLAQQRSTPVPAGQTLLERLKTYLGKRADAIGKVKRKNKMPSAEELAAKFDGKEDELWTRLEAKYGPEEDDAVLLISTDPAHSLGDAFKIDFKGGMLNRVPGVSGLRVLEIDPSVMLKKEVKSWTKLGKMAGFDTLQDVAKFQKWLTSIPGIDEATALASVIPLIDSGKYSTIVFDTAPTGHTLKLLQLPDMLQVGLDQIQSLQGKLWGMMTMAQNFFGGGENGGGGNSAKAKKKVEEKLRSYKQGVVKVGRMLKDNTRTTFIPVTIGSHLSVAETLRLLSELHKEGIHTSHVVVNQLIPADTIVSEDDLVNAVSTLPDGPIKEGMVSSARLCGARRSIQQSYVSKLLNSQEVKDHCLDVVQLPLLSTEVTGADNLHSFSRNLVIRSPPEGSSHEEL